VLVAALTVDSIGNGLFAPLSLVYFVRLTDVPLPLVGVGCSALVNALSVPAVLRLEQPLTARSRAH